MLINESGDIVDLVVDNEVEILLGLVFGNLLEGQLLVGGHDDGFQGMKERIGRWISDKGDELGLESRETRKFDSTG